MDHSIRGSELLTKERYDRQQSLRNRKNRKKLYCQTPEGVEVTAEVFLEPLTKFLRNPDNPLQPPPELRERLDQMSADPWPHVALAILAPILDTIARGRESGDRALMRNRKGVTVRKRDPWRTALTEQLGIGLRDWLVQKEMEQNAPLVSVIKTMETAGIVESIPRIRRGRRPAYKFLYDDWTASECVVAGDWMLRIALSLPCFGEDDDRIYITPEWQDKIDKICEDLLRRHPVMLPHLSPPKPWTGWRINYSDRIGANFVRNCWHSETKKAVEETFEAAKGISEQREMDDLEVQRMIDDGLLQTEPSSPFAKLAALKYSVPFAHADGVNALKAVPLRINREMLPLVDKFAVEIMGRTGDQQEADRKTVEADLRHARWCEDNTIYLDYNCDDRGRIYSTQQLHFAREDHVRSLFEFARGVPLTEDGAGGKEAMEWLEIHVANCWGEDKEPWADRMRWAKKNTDLIERVAADPQGSFDDWRNADKQFAFVAACKELSRARKDPRGFITHQPIGFDGTCNGIQHLAMLSRDAEVGRLVNLVHNDRPQDIYSIVIAHIMEMLECEDRRLGKEDCEWFGWWRNRLRGLDDNPARNEKLKRKLLKTPIMTFAYSSTVRGMRDKIIKAHAKMLPKRTWPEDAAAVFLARAVRQACKDKLPGPARIMKYIQDLALYRFKQRKFLEMRGLTGFPFANICYKSNIVDVDLDYGGIRSRYTVGDGDTPEIVKSDVFNEAAPNFVHFLDAAHLIFTVLEANKEGIRDILPVHDSYSCLAPHAQRFGQIIRAQFAALYYVGDPLRALCDANVSDQNTLPLPELGNLNPLDVQSAEYTFM